MRPHLGEGVTDFVVAYRHQNPNLEIQHMFQQEQLIVSAAVAFLSKSLWLFLVPAQHVVPRFLSTAGHVTMDAWKYVYTFTHLTRLLH